MPCKRCMGHGACWEENLGVQEQWTCERCNGSGEEPYAAWDRVEEVAAKIDAAWMFVEELAYSALIDLQDRIRLVRTPQEYRNLFG